MQDLHEYIRTGQVGDDLTRRIDEAVIRARKNEEWRSEYMKELLHDDDVRAEGRAEGETLGVSRINQLILELSKHGRTDDIVKAAADREYQKKLLEEFDL